MAGDDKPMRPEATEVVGPPRLLAGKYRVGKLIGEGGMGSVYLAEHTGLGAQVAVKLMSETCIADPDSVARFRREAKAMGAVRHDNVVAVMDTGTDEEGVPFIVMEYLEGESLSAVLRRNRTMAQSSACRIAMQILAGLGAAHKKGIVHRDLKPANLFMARQDDSSVRAKILDFGVSKLVDTAAMAVTADGVAVGTPTYMAPEQVLGESDIDARADLYAVGVILYRMLSGKLPFVAGTSEELSGKILDGAPAKPSAIAPGISPQLEAVVLKAMHIEAKSRYQDTESFSEALTGAMKSLLGPGAAALVALETPEADLGAQTVAASPAAKRLVSDVKKKSGRRPRIAFAGLVLALVAALAALLVWRSAATGPEGPPLRFGITQFLPTSELTPRFESFLRYLGNKLDRPIELRIASDADELRSWLAAGDVELAALSPFPYALARREIGELRLLATTVTPGGRAGYYGSILTRTESDIRELAEVKDRPFCFVRSGSTSGWLLPRRELRRAGLDPDRDLPSVHYGQDHLGTLKLLAKGACDAAAVYTKLWHDADDHGLDPASFRSISDYLMPHDAYVVAPSMDRNEAERIRAALLSLEPGTALAQKVLRNLDQGGFILASEEAYAPISEAIAAEPSLK